MSPWWCLLKPWALEARHRAEDRRLDALVSAMQALTTTLVVALLASALQPVAGYRPNNQAGRKVGRLSAALGSVAPPVDEATTHSGEGSPQGDGSSLLRKWPVEAWRRAALMRAGGHPATNATSSSSLVQEDSGIAVASQLGRRLEDLRQHCRHLGHCGCLERGCGGLGVQCGWCESAGTGLLGAEEGPHSAEGLCEKWVWNREECPRLWCPSHFDTSSKWASLLSASLCPAIIWCLFTLATVTNHLLQESEAGASQGLAMLCGVRPASSSAEPLGTQRRRPPRSGVDDSWQAGILLTALPKIFLQAYIVSSLLSTWRMIPVMLPVQHFDSLVSVVDSTHTAASALVPPMMALFAFYCVGRALWWRQAWDCARAVQRAADELAAELAASLGPGEDLSDVYRYVVLLATHSLQRVAEDGCGFLTHDQLEDLCASGWLTNAESKVLAGSGVDGRVLDKWIILWASSRIRQPAQGQSIEDGLRGLRRHTQSLQEVLQAPAPWFCHAALYTLVRVCFVVTFGTRRAATTNREVALETPVELEVVCYILVAGALQLCIEVLSLLRHPFGAPGAGWASQEPWIQAMVLETEARIRRKLALKP